MAIPMGPAITSLLRPAPLKPAPAFDISRRSGVSRSTVPDLPPALVPRPMLQMPALSDAMWNTGLRHWGFAARIGFRNLETPVASRSAVIASGAGRYPVSPLHPGNELVSGLLLLVSGDCKHLPPALNDVLPLRDRAVESLAEPGQVARRSELR